MNDRSQLPPERRRAPLDNDGKYCQVTSAFPQAKPVKVLMGDPHNNDSTLTSAVLDRLLHHAETVIIDGKSYRM